MDIEKASKFAKNLTDKALEFGEVAGLTKQEVFSSMIMLGQSYLGKVYGRAAVDTLIANNWKELGL